MLALSILSIKYFGLITLITEGDFTNLVALSVANVPPTVAAQLSSPTISANQTVFSALSPTTSSAIGVVPFTLTGTANLGTGTNTESLPLNVNVVGGRGTRMSVGSS